VAIGIGLECPRGHHPASPFGPLAGPAGLPSLQTAHHLFPEGGAPRQLIALLDLIDAHGLDAVLDDLRNQALHLSAVHAWLDTPTWEASHEHALRHPDLLTDPRTPTSWRSPQAPRPNSISRSSP
jgi:hypothetical protein